MFQYTNQVTSLSHTVSPTKSQTTTVLPTTTVPPTTTTAIIPDPVVQEVINNILISLFSEINLFSLQSKISLTQLGINLLNMVYCSL